MSLASARMGRCVASATVLLLVVSSCTGRIGAGGEEESRGEGQGGGSSFGRPPAVGPGSGAQADAPAPSSCTPTGAVPPAPLRRLTRFEYTNTVRELLRLETRVADGFPADTSYEEKGFETNSADSASHDLVRHYMEAAERIAALADVSKLLPTCAAGASEEVCARRFIETFGRRAYRRPLDAGQIDRLLRKYSENRGRVADFPAAIRVLITGFLQSPSFLYRIEAPQKPDAFDLATRLSYFLWQSMPDDQLLAAAENGTLSSAAVLRAEATRMMGDRRFVQGVRSFHRQWLGLTQLDGLSKSQKEFTATIRESMKEETYRFAEALFREGGGSLQTLLGAPYSFVDAELARLYAASPVPASGFARVDLPAGQRSGILTQAGPLIAMARSDDDLPVFRGLFVRTRLLCQDVNDPPPAAADEIMRIDRTLPIKQQLERHRANPGCNACHQLMDPLGFGLEKYDAIGRWRASYGPGKPVDATGELVGTDADGRFDGAIELGARLARTTQAQKCVARQWIRFALGRRESAAEECVVETVHNAFARSNLNLVELVSAVATRALSVGGERSEPARLLFGSKPGGTP